MQIATRTSKILAAAVGAFVVAVATVVGYWGSAGGTRDAGWALEFAAVLTGALIAGALVGAACGFLVYVLTQSRDETS